MLFVRKDASDAPSFEAGKPFYFGVLSGKPALEQCRCGRDVMMIEGITLRRVYVGGGCLELASFFDVVVWDLTDAGVVARIHRQ